MSGNNMLEEEADLNGGSSLIEEILLCNDNDAQSAFDLLSALVAEPGVDTDDDEDYSVWHRAGFHGRHDILAIAENSGLSLYEDLDADGDTPWHYIVDRVSTDELLKLVRDGVISPLMLANRQTKNLWEYLVSKGLLVDKFVALTKDSDIFSSKVINAGFVEQLSRAFLSNEISKCDIEKIAGAVHVAHDYHGAKNCQALNRFVTFLDAADKLDGTYGGVESFCNKLMIGLYPVASTTAMLYVLANNKQHNSYISADAYKVLLSKASSDMNYLHFHMSQHGSSVSEGFMLDVTKYLLKNDLYRLVADIKSKKDIDTRIAYVSNLDTLFSYGAESMYCDELVYIFMNDSELAEFVRSTPSKESEFIKSVHKRLLLVNYLSEFDKKHLAACFTKPAISVTQAKSKDHSKGLVSKEYFVNIDNDDSVYGYIDNELDSYMSYPASKKLKTDDNLATIHPLSSNHAPVVTGGKHDLVACDTVGDGDCSIHAMFGKPNELGLYACNDVEKYRNTLAEVIRACASEDADKNVKDGVQKEIAEYVMDNDNINASAYPALSKFRKDYLDSVEQDKRTAEALREKFKQYMLEKNLLSTLNQGFKDNQHDTGVIDGMQHMRLLDIVVQGFTKDTATADIMKYTNWAVAKEDSRIKQMLQEYPDLNKIYGEYINVNHNSDVAKLLYGDVMRQDVLDEYARIVAARHNHWLTIPNVRILAKEYKLNLNVHYHGQSNAEYKCEYGDPSVAPTYIILSGNHYSKALFADSEEYRQYVKKRQKPYVGGYKSGYSSGWSMPGLALHEQGFFSSTKAYSELMPSGSQQALLSKFVACDTYNVDGNDGIHAVLGELVNKHCRYEHADPAKYREIIASAIAGCVLTQDEEVQTYTRDAILYLLNNMTDDRANIVLSKHMKDLYTAIKSGQDVYGELLKAEVLAEYSALVKKSTHRLSRTDLAILAKESEISLYVHEEDYDGMPTDNAKEYLHDGLGMSDKADVHILLSAYKCSRVLARKSDSYEKYMAVKSKQVHSTVYASDDEHWFEPVDGPLSAALAEDELFTNPYASILYSSNNKSTDSTSKKSAGQGPKFG